MLFTSSGSVYPRAIFADMYASGYPVALLARADERESLGFTSIAAKRDDFVSKAYCMLHSPMMSTYRIASSAARRIS